MPDIITVLVNDAEEAFAALSALAPPKPAAPIPTSAAPAAAAPVPMTASSVTAQIEATSLSQGLATLNTVYQAIAAKASAIAPGTILTIEDIAGMVDPALIPLFGAVNAVTPIVTAAFAALASGTAAPQNYWLGAPRAI